jgi:Leucine-rich repeat (LRR) protein
MACANEQRLLEEFLNAYDIVNLDASTKAALRLCCKWIKACIDPTISACRVSPDALDLLIRCKLPVKRLKVSDQGGPSPSPEALQASLHAVVCRFPLLRELSIFGCSTLEALPDNIGDLSRLSEFCMGPSMLTALPPSFGQLTALDWLELDMPQAASWEGLAPIQQLKQLKDFAFDSVDQVHPSSSNFLFDALNPVTLEYLRLGGLPSLPASIENFKQLTALILSSKTFSFEIPDSIGSLSALRHLRLANTGDDGSLDLPLSISRLSSLRYLDIFADTVDLSLIQLPTRLEMLDLNIDTPDMNEYPECMWNLTKLRILKLSFADVNRLPEEVSNLKRLKMLHLHHLGELVELPEAIGDLRSLVWLELLDCEQLVTLPDSITKLKNLHLLRIVDCSAFRALPASFGRMKQLIYLEMRSCSSFSELPDSIGRLWFLTALVIINCPLTRLPAIGGLRLLRMLRVNDCASFTSIHDAFGDLVWGPDFDLTLLGTEQMWEAVNKRYPGSKARPCLQLANFQGCPNLEMSTIIERAVEVLRCLEVLSEATEPYPLDGFERWPEEDF